MRSAVIVMIIAACFALIGTAMAMAAGAGTPDANATSSLAIARQAACDGGCRALRHHIRDHSESPDAAPHHYQIDNNYQEFLA